VLKKDLRRAPEIPLKVDLPRGIHHAEVHRPGVEIDPSVVLVLSGVESHRVSLPEVLVLRRSTEPTLCGVGLRGA
jgi:hypothetical protein